MFDLANGGDSRIGGAGQALALNRDGIVAMLCKEVGDFKSFTARRILDHLHEQKATTLLGLFEMFKRRHKAGQRYQLWQEGSHPQLIQDEEMMRQKLEYIHSNPVKRGYVDDPTHWRHSSARNYAGLPGLFPVKTDW